MRASTRCYECRQVNWFIFCASPGIVTRQLVFGARTGGANDNHWIDDVRIANHCPTADSLNVSVAPNGSVTFQLPGSDPDNSALYYLPSGDGPEHFFFLGWEGLADLIGAQERGKKISTADANALQSELSLIRQAAGCL